MHYCSKLKPYCKNKTALRTQAKKTLTNSKLQEIAKSTHQGRTCPTTVNWSKTSCSASKGSRPSRSMMSWSMEGSRSMWILANLIRQCSRMWGSMHSGMRRRGSKRKLKDNRSYKSSKVSCKKSRMKMSVARWKQVKDSWVSKTSRDFKFLTQRSR